jgi:V8-like Glu-specific endopeptidase
VPEVRSVPNETGGAPIEATPIGEPAVGALFDGDGHYCSGSVVHSPAGNEVLTAAHCIHGGAGGDYFSDITFAPGYHDGIAPYGMWAVTSALVAPGWIDDSDPDLDVGFVTVRQDGNPNPIESITGANQLGVDNGFTNDVTLTGYPDDAESPVVCQNTTTQQSDHQLRIACGGFPVGTSGGPWIIGAGPDTNLGTVIGVIGGYQLGGGGPDVSYSSYFDTDIEALYRASTSETH